METLTFVALSFAGALAVAAGGVGVEALVRRARQTRRDFASLAGMIDYLYESQHPPDAVDKEIVDEILSRRDAVVRRVLRGGPTRDAPPVEQMFFNLLAVIHRDGGHHRQRFGVEKAALDAEEVVLSEREALDRASGLLDSATSMYFGGGFVGDNVDRWMNSVTVSLRRIREAARRSEPGSVR